mgnify:CR=1 FL=1
MRGESLFFVMGPTQDDMGLSPNAIIIPELVEGLIPLSQNLHQRPAQVVSFCYSATDPLYNFDYTFPLPMGERIKVRVIIINPFLFYKSFWNGVQTHLIFARINLISIQRNDRFIELILNFSYFQ